MSRTNKILSVAALAFVGACQTQTSGPAPAPEPEQSGPTVAEPGDVVPVTLHVLARPADVPTELARAVIPMSPRDPVITPVPGGERAVSKSGLVIVPAGSSAQTLTLPIDSTAGEAMLLLIGRSGPSKALLTDIEVRSPDGKVINRRHPKAGRELAPMDSISLAGLPTGLYTIRIGNLAAQAGLSIATALPAADVELEVAGSEAVHFPGQATSIDVMLRDGAGVVTGASVRGHLVTPSGTDGASLVFSEAGGGRYTASLSQALLPADKDGMYNVRVYATGVGTAGKFTRQADTAVRFVVPTARMLGTGVPRTITDASGQVEAFEVDVRVQVASPDRYELSGILVGSNADAVVRPVGGAQTAELLEAGTHTMTLRFDAGLVKLSKVAGNLELRNLNLFSQGRNALQQRLAGGMRVRIAAVPADRLASLKTISPALDQMIEDGAFDLR